MLTQFMEWLRTRNQGQNDLQEAARQMLGGMSEEERTAMVAAVQTLQSEAPVEAPAEAPTQTPQPPASPENQTPAQETQNVDQRSAPTPHTPAPQQSPPVTGTARPPATTGTPTGMDSLANMNATQINQLWDAGKIHEWLGQPKPQGR